jgi:pimeloyl-ACP methyl ester carboxylesterase
MAMLVLVHGAWHQGSAWDATRPFLTERGHHVISPTLSHEPGTRLRDHVGELVAVIEAAAEPVTLVAHSYAGLPALQAAALTSGNIARVVAIDAWLARPGQSLLDIAPEWFADWCRRAAIGDGLTAMLPIPPMWTVGIDEDSPEALWLGPRLVAQPMATFTDPVVTAFDGSWVDRHAIVCSPSLMPFRDLARSAGYTIHTIESGHDVMVSAPRPLADLLDRLVRAVN